MNEARRFLRYVTPGIVFFTEVVLLLAILYPAWTLSQIATRENSSLGVLVAAILASGGLGFVFSIIHHDIHWGQWLGESPIDYRALIQRLRGTQLINLHTLGSDETIDWENNQPTREQAWILTGLLWDERRKKGSLEAASAEIDFLNDVFNSLGTVRVGAFVAPLAVAVIAVYLYRSVLHTAPHPGQILAATALALGWICTIQSNCTRVGGFAKTTLEQALTNALDNEAAAPFGYAPRVRLVRDLSRRPPQ